MPVPDASLVWIAELSRWGIHASSARGTLLVVAMHPVQSAVVR